MRQTNRTNSQGFLLAEVAVAVTIIAVVLVVLVYMFINATQSRTASARETAATALAQKQLELLKAKPESFWAAIPVDSYMEWQGLGDGAAKNGNAWVVPVNSVDYTIATQVQNCLENSNMVQVIIIVSWVEQDAAAVNRELMVTAFYSKS